MSVCKSREFLFSQVIFLVFAVASFFLRHQGLSFFDASDFSTAIQGTAIPHAPGYPLYVLLGKFFNWFVQDPFDAQFWVNILAAWITSVFLFLTLAANRPSALLAVLFLLAQSLFQQYILIPEVFTLNLALVSMLIYFHQRFDQELKSRYLFAIGLMYGLGLCHHHLMALMVPASAFLLIRGLRKTRWLQGLGSAALGFVVGLLPLIYFFVSTKSDPNYTYYSVTNLQELLFVVLRQGYGTFKMTGSAAGVSAYAILGVIFGGLFKSGLGIGLLGGVAAMPGYWLSKKPVRAEAVLSISTMIIFMIAFSIMANFPIETLEGKNAFLRYLTFPGFLLLFPLSYGWEWLSRRFGRKVFGAGAGIAFAMGIYSLVHLNYRHYSTIDFHVAQAYHTIQRVMGPQPDTNIEPQFNRCIIFALTDPFHFGGRYYNEFQTDYRCYIFSVATVITGQFQARAEQKLVQKILGADYVLNGKTREAVMLEFFYRAMQDGYRIFAMYPGDLTIFQKPDMQISPVGNIIEILSGAKQIPAEQLAQEYALYLESLKVILSTVEEASIQPEALSDTAVQAPFTNMGLYPQVLKTTPEIIKTADEVRGRAEKFLTHVK